MDDVDLDELGGYLEVLDRAIGIVCADKFAELQGSLPRAQVTSLVADALRELQRLQDPRALPPNYNNPWVALCYALWYQPGQTLLVFLALNRIAITRETERLRIIDFGCGALVTDIAVDIAINSAGLGQKRVPLDCVYVDSLDASETMIEMGKHISGEMLSDENWLERSGNFSSERRFVNLDLSNLRQTEQDEECLLTAFHTVYKDSSTDVRSTLRKIHIFAKPNYLIMSADRSKEKLLRRSTPLSGMTPFPLEELTQERVNSLPPMSTISEVRRTIAAYASESKLGHQQNDDAMFVMRYMNNDPTWLQSTDRSILLSDWRS